MMRINFIVVSRTFFGAERRLFRILRYIDQEFGTQVEARLLVSSTIVVTARGVPWAADLLDRLAASNRLSVLPDRPGHLREAHRPLRFVSAVWSPVPLHGFLRSKPIVYLRGLLGRRNSLEIAGVWDAERVLRTPYFLLRRVSVFRCVSPSVAHHLQTGLEQRLGATKAKRLSRNIVTASSPFFEAPAVTIDPGLEKNVIVSASRFIPRKNVLLIAQALAIALPKLPGWSARLLGEGEQEAAIRKVLAPFISQDRVWIGYEPRVEQVLRQSRIYVSTITRDNYPSQSILESMAYENAIIVSDDGDSGLFLGPEENGVLTQRDPQQVAERMIELASAGERLERMQRASGKHVRSVFSARAHVTELLRIHLPELEPSLD